MSDLKTEVKAMIIERLELEGMTPDHIDDTSPLFGEGLGLDSIVALEWVLCIEQHFGVKHKERLKDLRAEVHALTLSATPIPRTLQLALAGVREMSIIATPPIDRMAVRTYVTPFDGVTVREALLREKYRGGQSFFVAPRISDLEDISDFLRRTVPEVTFAVAHGQMAAGALDEQARADQNEQQRPCASQVEETQQADPAHDEGEEGPAAQAGSPDTPAGRVAPPRVMAELAAESDQQQAPPVEIEQAAEAAQRRHRAEQGLSLIHISAPTRP